MLEQKHNMINNTTTLMTSEDRNRAVYGMWFPFYFVQKEVLIMKLLIVLLVAVITIAGCDSCAKDDSPDVIDEWLYHKVQIDARHIAKGIDHSIQYSYKEETMIIPVESGKLYVFLANPGYTIYILNSENKIIYSHIVDNDIIINILGLLESNNFIPGNRNGE